jgi:hypothetical protein
MIFLFFLTDPVPERKLGNQTLSLKNKYGERVVMVNKIKYMNSGEKNQH